MRGTSLMATRPSMRWATTAAVGQLLASELPDGRLGRWTRADPAESLLDYFPRKVSVDDETLGAVPDCVRAFLGWLEERGSLTGEPLEQPERALGELRDEFDQRAHDNSQWGLANPSSWQMQADGVDACAPGALDTWITDFNALTRTARTDHQPRPDRMTDAAGLRPAAGTQRASAPGQIESAGKRKSGKTRKGCKWPRITPSPREPPAAPTAPSCNSATASSAAAAATRRRSSRWPTRPSTAS
jgi:hypothetical protein